MNCEDTHRFVDAYIDGELVGEDAVSMEAHFQGCERCGQSAEFEAWFREGIRRALPSPKAPAELRDRVLRTLAEEAHVHRAPRRKLRPRHLIAALPALGAVAALIALAWVSLPQLMGPDPLVVAAVEAHRRRLPVEVGAIPPGDVQRWFWGKLDFPVRPPSLPPSRDVDMRLVGARMSHVGPHPAAQLMYEVEGAPLTVMAFRPGPISKPVMAAGQAPPRPPVRVQSVGGYNVARVDNRGVTYTFTGDVPPQRMVRFVSDGLP